MLTLTHDFSENIHMMNVPGFSAFRIRVQGEGLYGIAYNIVSIVFSAHRGLTGFVRF